jgi:SAM-dependent methyltransferase
MTTRKAHQLSDSSGTAHIDELPEGGCQIEVVPSKGSFCPQRHWRTRYPLELVRHVAQVESTAFLCDEIMRDEDPDYVLRDLRFSLLAYVDPEAFRGKTLLDFGCGGGASTLNIARMLPDTRLVGVELEQRFISLAQALATFHKRGDVLFLTSPSGDSVPPNLPDFDFVLLSAVYEHLLPSERFPLISQLWARLSPGGVMFVNQTPDLRFPIEAHTTGLPLVNYLPDGLAHEYACRMSKRVDRSTAWSSLLRRGIRGTTPDELTKILGNVSGAGTVERMQPQRLGIRRQSEIWYLASEPRMQRRYGTLKRNLVRASFFMIRAARIPIAPYVSLAFRKRT